MYYIVYLTTNLVNKKIYVGVHSTYNLDDGYLGSVKLLNKKFLKFGKEKFERKILYYCLNKNEAYEIENFIVDKQFIKRYDTYNLKVGGRGNWGATSYNSLIEDGLTFDEAKEYFKKIGLSKRGYKLSKEKMSKKKKGKIQSEEIE